MQPSKLRDGAPIACRSYGGELWPLLPATFLSATPRLLKDLWEGTPSKHFQIYDRDRRRPTQKTERESAQALQHTHLLLEGSTPEDSLDSYHRRPPLHCQSDISTSMPALAALSQNDR